VRLGEIIKALKPIMPIFLADHDRQLGSLAVCPVSLTCEEYALFASEDRDP
jgi:hypothetical protein